MDVKYINPFITGLKNVAGMMGITDLQRTGLSTRKRLRTKNDINIIIGLAGDIQGNVVFSMLESTACQIASAMMSGMPVPTLDPLAKSALCELANMVVGNSASYSMELGVSFYITPPTLFSGKDTVAMISQVETLVVEFNSNAGSLELNIALEL
jgi:chemotaxis protein CheX